MTDTYKALFAIAIAVVGVAIVSVLVSNQSQTGSVLTGGATGLGNALKAALSPLSASGGTSVTSSISYM